MATAKLVGEVERLPMVLELTPEEQDVLYDILRSVGGPTGKGCSRFLATPRSVTDGIRTAMASARGEDAEAWAEEVEAKIESSGSITLNRKVEP